jgi:16S rRNA (guanine966-N2)-methyltransferase
VRVIAGSLRGRPLRGPKSNAIRPTSDIAKGALFSMLDSLIEPPATIADLFAGSGALGIEALSRGASHATFIDESRDAIGLVRQNLEALGLADAATLHLAALPRAIERLPSALDLVVLDPPYAWEGLAALVAALEPRLTPGGAIAAEHSPRLALPDRIGTLERVRARRHGDTMLSIFLFAEPA